MTMDSPSKYTEDDVFHQGHGFAIDVELPGEKIARLFHTSIDALIESANMLHKSKWNLDPHSKEE